MPDLQTAITLASKDTKFGRDLAAHPEKYQVAFNLTDKQVAELRKIGQSKDFSAMASAQDYIG